MKLKTVYVCSNCGADSPKWIGKCPNCGEWNTYVEENISVKSGKAASRQDNRNVSPVKISDIKSSDEVRISLPSGELNRVLGGGLVPGSIVLIGGEPGIGKSTLVLQNVLRIRSRKVLYVSGEESVQQLKMRADRIGGYGDGCECYIVCETSLESIFESINNSSPDLIIIDSIQTIATENLESAAGSVAQVRECASALLKFVLKIMHSKIIIILYRFIILSPD